MESAYILNPIEQLKTLFDTCLSITSQTQLPIGKAGTHEDKEIVTMMQKIKLEDAMQDQEASELDVHGGMSPFNGLMYSPRNNKDLLSFKWMLPPDFNTQELTAPNLSQSNKYLKYLLNILQPQEQEYQFQFFEVYPHSHNLVANCDIKQGSTIIEISEEWMFQNQTTPRTIFSNYLEFLTIALLNEKKIFSESFSMKEHIFISQIRRMQGFNIPLYIFEKKFIDQIIIYPNNKSIAGTFQWLYFCLLPEDFDYHPLKHCPDIMQYHKSIGLQLSKLQDLIAEQYISIKSLIDGQYMAYNYSFRAYLSLSELDGIGIFEKYQKLFIPQNYTWAKMCEKTRAFEFKNNPARMEYDFLSDKAFIKTKKVLIPFLDLLHHSSIFYNLLWQYNTEKSCVLVKACKDIKKGDLLYIKYREMPIQRCFINYGFVDANEKGCVDLNVSIDINFIQWIATELFQLKSQKNKFLKYLTQYARENELKFEVKIAQYSADCYQAHKSYKDVIQDDIINIYLNLAKKIASKFSPFLVIPSLIEKQQMTVRTKMRSSIATLVLASLRNNIQQKKYVLAKIIQKINKYFTKSNTQKKLESSEEGMMGQEAASQKLSQKDEFNSLYNLTALKTIITTQVAILQKARRLFEKNQLK